MRYENWDVLLFPEGSKAPIQEFRTQCYVTRDRESPYLANSPFFDPSSYYLAQRNLAQLPVLTTFIPSLPCNSVFRVSVHSWERPRPSRMMESLMQPEDSVLFEVRVFIDGVCTAGSIFSQRTSWPHVIDLSSQIDKNGNQDNLRFPPFHQEILQQSHWDAGELHGRIRIVIAEGFSRPHRSPPFERVKDIIAFSFQHAPLHILECSNIAWPNAGMWFQPISNIFKYHSGSCFNDRHEADDVHAHSPTRHEGRSTRAGGNHPPPCSTWPYKLFPHPPAYCPSGPRDLRWDTQDLTTHEPPTEPYVGRRRARSTLEDLPMPDYVTSSSTSSRAISNMTGISYEHSKQPSTNILNDDEACSQFIDTHSPTKILSTAAFASTNTLSSMPTMGSKPSAAAKARSASYSKNGQLTSALKEISQPTSRDISGSSAKSIPIMESIIDAAVSRKIHVSPNSNVKGKKEAKPISDNGPEALSTPSTERRASKEGGFPPRVVLRTAGNVDVGLAEAKRRRPSARVRDRSSQMNGDGNITPLPSNKKISRIVDRENEQQESFDGLLETTPMHITIRDVE